MLERAGHTRGNRIPEREPLRPGWDSDNRQTRQKDIVSWPWNLGCSQEADADREQPIL